GAGAIDAEAAEGRSPRHRGSFRAHWDYSAGAAIDATLYLVGALPNYDIPAYTRFDLRWSTEISPSVRFELVGQNLFDDSHREFSAAADPAAPEVEPSLYGRLVGRR